MKGEISRVINAERNDWQVGWMIYKESVYEWERSDVELASVGR